MSREFMFIAVVVISIVGLLAMLYRSLTGWRAERFKRLAAESEVIAERASSEARDKDNAVLRGLCDDLRKRAQQTEARTKEYIEHLLLNQIRLQQMTRRSASSAARRSLQKSDAVPARLRKRQKLPKVKK